MLEQLSNKKARVHLVGIAGIGMSGIARMLLSKGYAVSGSDLVSNDLTSELASLGVHFQEGHDAKLVDASDIVVRSSAVKEDNPELVYAHKRGVPIVQRAEMLAEIMEDFFRIAIAGSHGKTTTASIATSLLIKAKRDPSYVIGGILNEQGVNAHLGTGEAIVVEADESDASFLRYTPDIAIITNIDSDHLQTFGNDLDALEEAFFQFMSRVKSDGHIILCIDDPRLMRLAERSTRHVITYSARLESADYYVEDIAVRDAKSYFKVHSRQHGPAEFELSLPGHHNVANAMACIALGDLMQIEREATMEALKHFGGVGRRFQVYPLGDKILIDDYGHHPKEIEATIEAVKLNWPHRRLVHVFQPHRYTRTQQLFKDFVSALSRADELILLDLYAASESYIPKADSDALANAVTQLSAGEVYRVKGLFDLIKHADMHFRKDDVIVMQGAGSIGAMVKPLRDSLHVVTR